MNTNWNYIKQHIDDFPEYKSSIFEKGFLVTNSLFNFTNDFPYYDNWREERLCDTAHLYLHKNQNAYVLNKDGYTYFLIGHAYDPFGMEHDENKLLSNLANKCKGIFTDGIEYINDWTGLFLLGIINGDEFVICADFESMRTAYYGKINDTWYITSHEELLAINYELTKDKTIEDLENYRWYRLYGEALPGDTCHYIELKKLMANTYVQYKDNQFSLHRFFPNEPVKMCENEKDFKEVVEKVAKAMSNNMELIAKKWNKPQISATGGKDSKGTVAASYHIKDKFECYSYNSIPREKVDCDAASRICKELGIKHTTYDIPTNKEEYPEYDLAKAILHVNSNRKYFNHNDIMKRIYFKKLNSIEIEVKSWASEVGRAYEYQRLGVKRLQKKYKPRLANIICNIYLFSPILMHEIDEIYKKYFKLSEFEEHLNNYDWSDIVMIETRDTRWADVAISCEHYFSNDVAIPYNNRHLMNIMLSAQLEKRMNNAVHNEFTKLLCPKLDKLNINVIDSNHDTKRMWLDKIYYFITSIRPL